MSSRSRRRCSFSYDLQQCTEKKMEQFSLECFDAKCLKIFRPDCRVVLENRKMNFRKGCEQFRFQFHFRKKEQKTTHEINPRSFWRSSDRSKLQSNVQIHYVHHVGLAFDYTVLLLKEATSQEDLESNADGKRASSPPWIR